jgi:30S ribosomal protein S31
MGKGDKKTRRGKIILGTYGVRRPKKKADKAEIKPSIASTKKEVKEKKPVREKSEAKEGKTVAEVREPRVAKEKAAVKTPKVPKEKKEASEVVEEAKSKKVKKG